MNKTDLIALMLLFLSTIGVGAGIYAYEIHRTSQYSAILTAQAPERGNWNPKEIHVQYGQQVKILVRNIDAVSHGLAIPDFKIEIEELKAGHVQEVSFVADKRGEFPFMCTVWCSMHHLDMTGKIIVE